MDFVQTMDSAASGTSQAQYNFKPTDTDENGMRLLPLYDALVKAREKAELLRAKNPARDANGNPLPFEGILAITADKRIKYDTLRKIMYTAGASGYKVFRFIAQRKEI
jgi:hypothetical protein